MYDVVHVVLFRLQAVGNSVVAVEIPDEENLISRALRCFIYFPFAQPQFDPAIIYISVGVG